MVGEVICQISNKPASLRWHLREVAKWRHCLAQALNRVTTDKTGHFRNFAVVKLQCKLKAAPPWVASWRILG